MSTRPLSLLLAGLLVGCAGGGGIPIYPDAPRPANPRVPEIPPQEGGSRGRCFPVGGGFSYALKPCVALDTVRRRCRFRGRAYQACLYIAEQLLADERVDLDRLRALGLAKPKFYRDYVSVILKDFLADFYKRYRPIFDENRWFEQTWVAGFFAEG